MHPILRQAESRFALMMETFACPGSIPPQVDVRIDDDIFALTLVFRFDAGGQQAGFTAPMSQAANLGSPGRLYRLLRDLWGSMRVRRIPPLRLTVAQGAQIAAEWGPAAIALSPLSPSLRTLFGQAADADRIMREALYGGAAGDGMTTNMMMPQGEPPATLTAEIISEMVRRARGHEMNTRLAGVHRQQQEFVYERERQAECTCPYCRRQRDSAYVVAGSRSVALLKEWLSPRQLAQYERYQWFEVTGSSGTRYRIRHGRAQNIEELDGDGYPVRGLCFGPDGDAGEWPGDVMLAQKLALETDEAAAMAVANTWFGPLTARETERYRL